MGTGKTYKLKRSIREHFYLWKYVLLNHFLRGRNFFFMPWRRVKTNSKHLSVNDTFSVHRTELDLFKCRNSYFSVYTYIISHRGLKSIFIPAPTRSTERKRFGLSFSFYYDSQVRSIQVSFTKRGRGIYRVITPLKRRQSRLIGQDNIDSWNIFDVHEFSQFHTADYFIFSTGN